MTGKSEVSAILLNVDMSLQPNLVSLVVPRITAFILFEWLKISKREFDKIRLAVENFDVSHFS